MRRLAGIREYARHRGVSHPAVIQAIKTGRISAALVPVPGGKKLDVEAADRLWDANTERMQARGGATLTAETNPPAGDTKPANGETPAEPKGPRDLFGETPPPADDGRPKPGTFLAERTAREGWSVKTAELRYRQMAGELLPAVRYADIVERVSRSLRDAMYGMFETNADDLAVMDTREAIAARQRDDFDRLFEEFCNGLERGRF